MGFSFEFILFKGFIPLFVFLVFGGFTFSLRWFGLEWGVSFACSLIYGFSWLVLRSNWRIFTLVEALAAINGGLKLQKRGKIMLTWHSWGSLWYQIHDIYNNCTMLLVKYDNSDSVGSRTDGPPDLFGITRLMIQLPFLGIAGLHDHVTFWLRVVPWSGQLFVRNTLLSLQQKLPFFVVATLASFLSQEVLTHLFPFCSSHKFQMDFPMAKILVEYATTLGVEPLPTIRHWCQCFGWNIVRHRPLADYGFLANWLLPYCDLPANIVIAKHSNDVPYKRLLSVNRSRSINLHS